MKKDFVVTPEQIDYLKSKYAFSLEDLGKDEFERGKLAGQLEVIAQLERLSNQ